MDKTYCVFGDSVTQASYIKSGWVDLFRNYLETKYYDDFINVFNLGIGGNTSSDIISRFKNEAASRTPTDIIFAFGVNDSGYFRTIDKLIVQESLFEKNIKILIEEAKFFTSNITFIGPTLGDDLLLKPFPESSKGKSYDLDRLKIYNNKLKEIVQSNNCKYIELLDSLKFEDFIDGLHPNAQGHQKMFEVIRGSF